MNYLGSDFNSSGSVMAKSDLTAARTKRGECVTCGRKCYKKKIFKLIPIDEDGKVLNGRCLNCKPLQLGDTHGGGGGGGKIVSDKQNRHHHHNHHKNQHHQKKKNSPRRQKSHHQSQGHHRQEHLKQKLQKSNSSQGIVAAAECKPATHNEIRAFNASRRTKSTPPSNGNYYSNGGSVGGSVHSRTTANTDLTTRPSIATTTTTTNSSYANSVSVGVGVGVGVSASTSTNNSDGNNKTNNNYDMSIRSIGNASAASASSRNTNSSSAVAAAVTTRPPLNNNGSSLRSLGGGSVTSPGNNTGKGQEQGQRRQRQSLMHSSDDNDNDNNDGSQEIAWIPPPHHSEFGSSEVVGGSDNNSNSNSNNHGVILPPSRLNSYNSSVTKAPPTREELEQATLTLMAAQEHGLDNVFDELITSSHHHHHHHNNNNGGGSLHRHRSFVGNNNDTDNNGGNDDIKNDDDEALNRIPSNDSSRSSIQSGGGVEETKEEATATDDENDNDNDGPQDRHAAMVVTPMSPTSPIYRQRQHRGVLNRGGVFTGRYGNIHGLGGRHLPGVGVGTHIFTGSSRTLSSMSSIGEEDHGRHTTTASQQRTLTPPQASSSSSNNNNNNSNNGNTNSNSNGSPLSPGIYNMRVGSLSRFHPASSRTLESLSTIETIDEEEMQSHDEDLSGLFNTESDSDDRASVSVSVSVSSKSTSLSRRSGSGREEDETIGSSSARSYRDEMQKEEEEEGDNDTRSLSPPKRRDDDPNSTFVVGNFSSKGNSNCNSLKDQLITLRDYIESPNETRKVLQTLSDMPLDITNEAPSTDLSGMEIVIVNAMQCHENDREVQRYGCGAIWSMSDGSTQAQKAFVEAGAVSTIVRAMKRFLKSNGGEDLQEHAIATLSNLGATRSNVRFLVGSGDGVENGGDTSNDDAVDAIVNAMGHYSEFSGVQAKGCLAITNLASHDDSNLRLEIMDKGVGIAILFNSMAMHADNSTVQESALKAVWNLCADSESSQVKFLEFGVIDFVLTAMDRHKDVPGLQEAGAWIIYNLAKDSNETKIVIGDNRGIDTILRAITVHLHHAGVVEWCIRALFTLTFDPHNAASCLEKTVDEKLPPAIKTVIDAMMAHENLPAAQDIGCAVLTNLANLGADTSSSNLGVDPDQTKMYIVDGEALDAINMAMVLHKNECRVQEHACTLLHTLAIEDNHAAILAAIGIDMQLVKDAAKDFPNQCKESANKLIRLIGVDK